MPRPGTSEARVPLPALGVVAIVEAGLRMGVRDGFATLSMRTLARELNVSTMALYHHVPNKRGLMVLLVDAVLSEIPVPPPGYGDWTERLRELNVRSIEALSRFPGLDRVMFDIPPTPEGWRLMNGYVQILLDAGFPEREAALAFSVVHSYGIGRAEMERELRPSRRPDDSAELPALAQLNRQWPSMHRPAARGFAMDVILAGLRSMLADCVGEAPVGGAGVSGDAGGAVYRQPLDIGVATPPSGRTQLAHRTESARQTEEHP